MKQIIDIIRGKHIEAGQGEAGDCGNGLVCNYCDNYYGDQVCIAVKTSGDNN